MLIPILLIIQLLFASNSEGISGIVMDLTTQEPLSSANIFLKQAGLGTSSDQHGFFQIPFISRKNDTLIVRYIGYKQVEIPIRFTSDFSRFMKVYLESRSIQADSLSVVAPLYNATFIATSDWTLITPEMLHTIPEVGEPDIFYVLKSIPGISTVNDFNAGLYIRGGNRDQNLVLLDGMPILSPFHLFGIFSAFDTDAIQFVEVEKNIFNPEYGNRLGSIIQVNMRDGTSESHSGYGSLSLISAKLRAEGPHRWGSYMFSLRRTYADIIPALLYKFGALSLDSQIPYNFTDGLGKIVVKATLRHRIETQFYFNRDNYDFRIVDNNPKDDIYYWGNTAFGLSYYGLLSPTLTFHSQIVYTSFNADYQPEELMANESIYTRLKSWIWRIGSRWKTLSLGSISVGADFQNFDTQLKEIGFTYLPLNLSRSKSWENSIFGNWEYLFLNQLQLLVGARLTNFSHQKVTKLSSQVQFKITLSDRFDASIGWSKYHQGLLTIGSPASLMTLFDAWMPVPVEMPVMQATQYSAGLNWKSSEQPGMEITLSGFLKKYHNLVLFNSMKLSQYDLDFFQGKGDASGIETLIRWRSKKFSSWISYTYSHSKVMFNNQTYPPSYDRPHVLNLVSTYPLTSHWTLQTQFIYQTGTPFTKIIGYYRLNFSEYQEEPPYYDLRGARGFRSIPVYSAQNAYRLPPYHRLDLSFIYRFKKPLEFYIDLINVYARLNVLSYTEENNKWIQMPPLVTIGIRGKIW